jgi:hypothetical protein
MEKINFCNKCKSHCKKEDAFCMKVYHTHSNDPYDVSFPRNDKGAIVRSIGPMVVYICSPCGEPIFENILIEKNVAYNFCALCLSLKTCPHCSKEINKCNKEELHVEDIYTALRCNTCQRTFYPSSLRY